MKRLLRVYGRAAWILGRDRRLAALLTLVNLCVAAMQFLDPLLFGRVVALLGRSESTPRAALWTEAGWVLGIWACVGAVGIAANLTASLFADRMAHRNRMRAMHQFFEAAMALPLSFHGDTHSGRLMKIMMTGSEALFWLWLSFFREQCSTFIATLVLLPLTFFLNWRLALVLMALVLLFCTLTVLVIRHTEAAQRAVMQHHLALHGTAQDALANVTVMQSFSRLAEETRLFGAIARDVIRHQYPVLTWWAVVTVLTRAASTVATIVMVLVGTILHLDGQASVGEIVTFMGLALLLIGRLDSAMAFTARLFQEVAGLEEFFGVLDAPNAVADAPGARDLVAGVGEVSFEHVGFVYPSGPPVLHDVDFTARPGSVVALVGQTGAGKSTAMALLQRLWDPSSGRILIDGQDIRLVRLQSLRRHVGVVFQDAMLLNRSIRDNLLIGRPDASEAEIVQACEMADAWEFIVRQADGLDTMVGERGAALSGGQRQRLAIARALLKDPPILILDEATSALDAATEARVNRALKALMRGRTTFIVAHRLSTVRDADEILVFAAGEIVERGRFDGLLARGGVFAGLVATQLSPANPMADAVK